MMELIRINTLVLNGSTPDIIMTPHKARDSSICISAIDNIELRLYRLQNRRIELLVDS